MAWIETTGKLKSSLSAISDLLIIIQPFLGGLVYLSILAGYPPLWLSWLIFLAPFLLRWWLWGIAVKRTLFDVPIIILTVGLLVGVAVSPDKSVSLETLQTFLACILMYYSGVTNAMRITWYWKLVVLVTFIVFMTLATLTFAQTSLGVRIVSFNQWLYQAAGHLPFSTDYNISANALGTIMAISVPGFLAFSLLSKGVARRVVAGLLAAFCAFLLIMSASTNGLVAAFAGICFLLFLWKPWTIFLYLPAGICGIWLMIAKYYPAATSTWSWIVHLITDRAAIWRETLLILKDKVLTGIGLGTWFEQYASLGGDSIKQQHAHNDFLQLFSDCGLLGVLALFVAAAIFIIGTWRIWHSPKKNLWWVLGMSSAVALLALAANGIFETSISGFIVVSVSEGVITSYHCVAVPVIWVLAGIFSWAYVQVRNPNTSQGSHDQLSR